VKRMNKYLSSIGKTKRKELCRLIRCEKEARIEKTVFLLLRSFKSGMLDAMWCDTQTFSHDLLNSVCMWVLWQACIRDKFNTLMGFQSTVYLSVILVSHILVPEIVENGELDCRDALSSSVIWTK
jgi:hypothetical protein